MTKRTLRLLHIDDNPGDQIIIEEAFAQIGSDVEIYSFSESEEALQFLFACDSNGLPHIIFLDLNMPKVNGFEILAKRKEQERLKKVPVLVFSSSENPRDVARAYSLGANCYLIKPANFPSYLNVIGFVDRFWLRSVAL